MAHASWKNRQPSSLRQAMEWCLEYARERHNRSVDRVADLMGLTNKWVIYKWLESGKLPAILIRPFEEACGIDFVTRFLGHSAHKLLIEIPTGKRATQAEINALQGSFAEAISLLLKFYDGQAEAAETLSALTATMSHLAWHRGEVERNRYPELDLEGDGR